MTHIGRYLCQGSSLWDICATLANLSEEELSFQVKTYDKLIMITSP